MDDLREKAAAYAAQVAVTEQTVREQNRAKLRDLCPVIDGLVSLYGKENIKLVCAINTDGEEVGKVDQAFRDAARATWNAPPVVDQRVPVRRKK